MKNNHNNPIEIRDARNGNWFWVHTHVLKDSRISPSDKLIYSLLASYANTEQIAFPSITRIAKESSFSTRTVIRCLTNLEKYNYIKIDRNLGEKNIYTLCKTTSKNVSTEPVTPMSLVTPVSPTSDTHVTTTSDISSHRTIPVLTRPYNNNTVSVLSLTPNQVLKLKAKYPHVSVEEKAKRFNLWLKANQRRMPNVLAGFELWLMEDNKKSTPKEIRRV